MRRKIVVAVTGASGAIYARLTVEAILKCSEVEEVALILSDNGRAVMEYEGEQIALSDPRITLYDNSDMFAPVASGSAGYDSMVVVPCSVGTLGRVAAGVSADLIGRAADVMLKERRPLLMVLRETPLSTIHLHNLTTLSQCGAVILPASPSFYAAPATIEQLCMSVVERIIMQLNLTSPHFSWGSQE